MIQPHPPERFSRGNGANHAAKSIGDVAVNGQSMAVSSTHHAVNGRAFICLIPGNVGIVIQHLNGKHVFPGMQIGRQRDCFIILSVQIALAGAGQHGLIVDPEPITGNSRDPGCQARIRRQFLFQAEIREPTAQITMKNLLVAKLHVGYFDPLYLIPHRCFLVSADFTYALRPFSPESYRR